MTFKLPHASLVLCALALPGGLAWAADAPDPALTVPAKERAAETARLRALGLRVPDAGVVLERPWDQPFTAQSFVVPQIWLKPPSGDSAVAADALAADLPLLERLMALAYGGWDSAAARGWNWSKWFADWRAQLGAHAGKSLPLADAFAPMKALMTFQLDNHTGLPLGIYFGSSSATYVLSGSAKGACTEIRTAAGLRFPLDPKDPAQHVRVAKRWNLAAGKLDAVNYLAVPGSRGDVISVVCGGASIPLTAATPGRIDLDAPRASFAARKEPILALGKATKDEPDLKLLAPDVAYARFPTFHKINTQLIEQRLPTWPRPTGKESVLIVDLRDNQGGDAAVEALDKWLTPADMQRMAVAKESGRHVGASCAYEALRWGYSMISSYEVKPPLGEELTRELQSGIDALLKPSQAGCPRTFRDSKGSWGYAQHRLIQPGPVAGQRRILVLVNNGTGSDGEYMALLLASLPQTVLAGSNTFGVAQFIQPGFSVLPHTRLPFQIALGMSDIYGDHRSFDGYGLDVDVLFATPADQAPENIIALARYLGTGKAR